MARKHGFCHMHHLYYNALESHFNLKATWDQRKQNGAAGIIQMNAGHGLINELFSFLVINYVTRFDEFITKFIYCLPKERKTLLTYESLVSPVTPSV